MYGNVFISGLGLVEELLPGTDFIPTATIAWFLAYKDDEIPASESRINMSDDENDVIDVDVS